jgi:OOP family OmpA-OmpF porin
VEPSAEGARRFEAFRPRFNDEDRRRRREERQEIGRERLQDIVKQRRERREEGGRIVIEEGDNRRIFRGEGGRSFIRHDESARFRGKGRDFSEERGPRGERRVITTRGGVRIVTVLDDDGKLIRRIRQGPDGREFVLIDNRERRRHRRGERRSHGNFGFYIDLPAPVLRIPRERYYVYADRASEEEIEDTLSAPPVDDIEPEYSLDEIRSSPRLRERMPTVNLNTITFDFGSWEIAEDQIKQLDVMAKAIENILRRNPDEVFMIEGHTDAVGSDEDNLSLSDRRAEAVARVLSDEFNIPAENLVTQGYGEQYLLVDSQDAERGNRRVEFRRITPLLARGDEKPE